MDPYLSRYDPLRHDPELVHTSDLLNPNNVRDVSSLLRADSEIMRVYDLNEENLRILKQQCKCFSY